MQQSHTAKQEALDAIQRLPGNASTEEIMYQLYVLAVIHKRRHVEPEDIPRSAA